MKNRNNKDSLEAYIGFIDIALGRMHNHEDCLYYYFKKNPESQIIESLICFYSDKRFEVTYDEEKTRLVFKHRKTKI